ncbi:MAG: CinA family nicotinamide mononucleotide deamidase-related protein [Candidatus Caldatribacterium sp.]|uniref:CinA family nicotinamide mononucleotide deamidase-related protein n=1 Tax=Candidatus Caldatribacterium sp. TaxID=2282143 RepID=UPI002991CC56|nr:CinA family nicotinamide mononucleotide deamidase-related protein [Candidatus Caldatribacterium sp.]MCX7731116.1 CinA family nicotinamide mononucleotide deamidase-related protein [Candidatus Caldatribacterium sp.]MDW8081451.1 CinA family nicotinamide mononucleotide deamidase-related protein [Candidatus Calescibacterium sp.]
MNAAILCVGTELVTGAVRDSNASFLIEKLLRKGIFPKWISFIPDEVKEIAAIVRFLRDQGVDILFVIGGLGPTTDDLTREGIAEALERPLRFSEEAWEGIRRFYLRIRGVEPPENNKKQAFFPEGASFIPNEVGTAPAFILDGPPKIFVLPGVPREVEFFWHRLEREIPNVPGNIYRSTTLKFCGIGESLLEERMRPFLQELPKSLRFSFLPNYGEVWFFLYGQNVSSEEITRGEEILENVKKSLASYLFSQYGETLEEAIGKLLCERGLRIAIAESCTGGLVGSRITDIPGSSQYFDRGYIVYSNRAKIMDLGVPEGILSRFGAVSEETARYLAERVRHKAEVDIGLGITGIAGPGGGSLEKPVGLVYVGVSDGSKTVTKRFQFGGDRLMNKRFFAQAALTTLFVFLKER